MGLPPLGELRRSDLPRFFRAADLDSAFPADRLVASFAETLDGLGIDLSGQANVHLDAEPRRTKSPRAFCANTRVPDEVYLVIAPIGGRDDYAALFHEGGHTEHYANTDPGLAFEFRHLGDNSVTESFAFLIEHLVEDRAWLREGLGVEDPGAALAHARALKLLFVRRYAAKLAYELELHGPSPRLAEMPGRYAELMSAAVRVPLAAGELAGGRRRRLLRRLLPARLGARNPLAGRAQGAVRLALVRLGRGGCMAALAVAPRPATRRRRAARRDARGRARPRRDRGRARRAGQPARVRWLVSEPTRSGLTASG